MREEIEYSVPAMSCGGCVSAIEAELSAVPGVEEVRADLQTKLVTVAGSALDGAALRAAIEEAGYEAE
ncbi:MAG: heavy-metal-associated domain-containing protein [Actinomycetota bacterium]|nr:heavy-metal-associated domain-containing protein [Actinomycetota bacterium]